MSKTGIFGSILLALFGVIWLANALNTHRVRFQITVEVDTPQGVRSGFGMAEVTTWNIVLLPRISAYSSEEYARGEAAFVDLGNGKHVIALLASGPKGENSDWIRYVRGAFRRPAVDDSWNVLSPSRASTPLPQEWLPTLVTFSDINDPATAKVVEATTQGFVSAFGQGHALRSITMTYVNPGMGITHIWPFNQLFPTWPRWLFGEPLTTGIERRLGWINDPELGRNPRWMQLPDIAQTTITSLKRSGN